jgi:lipoprotein-releasing system permease protein
VWALIVVLSVMNGFQKEVRTRILGVVSHVQISGPGNLLPDWQAVAQAAAQHPRVIAAAPFVQGQAMLSAGRAVRGALVRGIEPGEEERVADFGRHMRGGSLDLLKPGEFGIVLGGDLARALGLIPGDKVALIAPQGVVTPAGVIPRLKQFTVVGIFEAGIVDADSGLALVNLRDAQTLYQLGTAVTGVRLKLDDLFAARAVARELMAKLPQDIFASDWTRSHANFFRAVEIEKRVMFIILALIILVAAINIISTLVVAVTDKQADIAILRTLGAAPASVMQIFVVQGMVIGLIGTLLGVATSIVTALNIDVIVPAIESAFKIKFLSKDVYLIPDLPSDLQIADVISVAFLGLGLSLFATLFPSWSASRVNPAEALRYE